MEYLLLWIILSMFVISHIGVWIYTGIKFKLFRVGYMLVMYLMLIIPGLLYVLLAYGNVYEHERYYKLLMKDRE